MQDIAVHVSSPLSQDASKSDASTQMREAVAAIWTMVAAIWTKESIKQFPSEMGKTSLDSVKAMASNYWTVSVQLKGIPDVPCTSIPYASNNVPYANKKRRRDEDSESQPQKIRKTSTLR